MDNNIKMEESAAKPNNVTSYLEGSETIPKGSTLLDSNNNGSASPRPDNAEGEEIVHRIEFYKLSFINRASKQFNNKFDYSLVLYKTMKTPVEIICPEHGTFWQRPMDHLRNKYGCTECAKKYKDTSYKCTDALIKAHNDNLMTKDKYILLINKKYNKLNVIIDDWNGLIHSVVKLNCSEHGYFYILAKVLLYSNIKYGCPECAKTNRRLHKTITYDKVIELCKAKYGDTYLYPESNRDIYVNKKTKIEIICPTHGSFYRSINKFLCAEQYCPKCRKETLINNGIIPGGYNLEWFNKYPDLKNIQGILYYLKITNIDTNDIYYKIGITKYNTPYNRIKSLKSSALRTSNEHIILETLYTKLYDMFTAYNIELEILLKFIHIRVIKSWSTELFSEDIYKNIKQYF